MYDDGGPGGVQATAGAPVTARYSHTATYIPSINKVLITGGMAPSGATGVAGTNAAELYDVATGTFASYDGSMAFDRVGHTATLVTIGGQDKVLITGGWSNAQLNVNGGHGAITRAVEIYDPATGTFSDAGAVVDQHVVDLAGRRSPGPRGDAARERPGADHGRAHVGVVADGVGRGVRSGDGPLRQRPAT